MNLARIVGLVVLVVLLVAVISEPLNSAAMARSGGQALGSVGSSFGDFLRSVTSGSSARVSTASDGTAVYVVRPGDTLSSIASTHGTSVDTLVTENGVDDPDLIRPGQEVALPRE